AQAVLHLARLVEQIFRRFPCAVDFFFSNSGVIHICSPSLPRLSGNFKPTRFRAIPPCDRPSLFAKQEARSRAGPSYFSFRVNQEATLLPVSRWKIPTTKAMTKSAWIKLPPT